VDQPGVLTGKLIFTLFTWSNFHKRKINVLNNVPTHPRNCAVVAALLPLCSVVPRGVTKLYKQRKRRCNCICASVCLYIMPFLPTYATLLNVLLWITSIYIAVQVRVSTVQRPLSSLFDLLDTQVLDVLTWPTQLVAQLVYIVDPPSVCGHSYN